HPPSSGTPALSVARMQPGILCRLVLDFAALHPGYPLLFLSPSPTRGLLHDSLGTRKTERLLSSLPSWEGARGRGYPAAWHPHPSPLPSREREKPALFVLLYKSVVHLAHIARKYPRMTSPNKGTPPEARQA